MAIVQISRIQHRKGLQQDLPQLASAELGWAIDSRRLYIGNGTIGEGAPIIGVTEILTQYSDILNIGDAYTFKGAQAGYTSQTGPTALTPITRTLQQKLDDYINVRDFGAKGDGNTNDTAAIQRAIDEVYFGNFAISTPKLRRQIHFPAGIYNITASLKLPSYAILLGEGKDRTIIRQTSNLFPVVQLKDSAGKVDADYGTSSSQTAKDILVMDLTLENLLNDDVVRLDTCDRVAFARTVFRGAQSNSNTGSITGQIAIYARPTSAAIGDIDSVTISDCDFYNCDYGLVLNATNVKLINCNFNDLSGGLYIDQTASAAGVKNIKVINSSFDRIARSAVYVNTSGVGVNTSVTSAMNYYGEVGTGLLGVGNATYPVINYTGQGNYSIGDTFDRTDQDAAVSPRVSIQSNSLTLSLDANVGLTTGMITRGSGRVITLAANVTNANTGIVLSNTTGAASIKYWLKRPDVSASRHGTIEVLYDGTNIVYQDEYTEHPNATELVYPGPTGITFSVKSISATQANISYTSTNNGTATFTYSITQFNQ